VSLVKPTAATNLGITVLGTQVDDTLFACVKALNKNGIAYLDGNIKVGHKILQVYFCPHICLLTTWHNLKAAW